jgi:hypothetical protein
MTQMKDIHLNVITVTVPLSTFNTMLGTVEQAQQLHSLIPVVSLICSTQHFMFFHCVLCWRTVNLIFCLFLK